MINIVPHKSSFRDPSGFLFYEDQKLLRQINSSYQKDYDLLIDSGLYKLLCDKNLMVKHQEVEFQNNLNENAYKISNHNL